MLATSCSRGVASMEGGLVTTLLLTTMSVDVTVLPPSRLVMKYVKVEYSVFTTSLARLCKRE